MFNTSLNNGGSDPVGTLKAWGGSTPPAGWLICDGSAISRTTYKALFNVIGTTYGNGNGSTTFNLPSCGGFGEVYSVRGYGKSLGLTWGTSDLVIPGIRNNDGYPTVQLNGKNSNPVNVSDSTSIDLDSWTGLGAPRALGLARTATKTGIGADTTQGTRVTKAIIKY